MVEWRIYYADGSVVSGTTAEEWYWAPFTGVQVVVWMCPYSDGFRPWMGVEDRQMWTGEDTYNPFGWGVKVGTLLPDATYHAIWEQAAHG